MSSAALRAPGVEADHPGRYSVVTPAIRDALKGLHVVDPWRGVADYLWVYALVALTCWAEVQLAHPLATLLAIFVIAGRQHTLYVLNHDASHATVVLGERANKAFSTALAVLPFLHHPEAFSYVLWRRVHRLHHLHLFTPGDPNWAGRKAQGDTERTHTPWSLFLACSKVGLTSVSQLFIGRQDYVPPDESGFTRRSLGHLRTLFVPFHGDPEVESERRLKLVVFAAAAAGITYAGLWWPVFRLWIVPMYTFYPALLHLMDLTEHRWTEDSHDLRVNTRMTRVGAALRWLLGTLHRPQHRAHHFFPRVPIRSLPRVSRLLSEGGFSPPPLRGLGQILSPAESER